MDKGFQIITVDGESACGKSTVGQIIADRAGYFHFDAGNYFRSLALYVNLVNNGRHDFECANMASILLDFTVNRDIVCYKGKNISDLIASEECGMMAFRLGQHKDFQENFVNFQRNIIGRLAKNYKGVVVSGRISGSVVFPEATHKFFLLAPTKIKAMRRQKQLYSRGFHSLSQGNLLTNLRERDNIHKILPASNLNLCNRTISIDTSQFKLHTLADCIFDKL